jgi:hypothetical protein
MRERYFAVAVTLALWGLGGCASYPPSTAIKASDSGATLPTIRVSTSLDGAADAGRGLAIELAIATGKGRDTQVLVAGQDPVKFGDSLTTFNAPQTLTHEFDVASFDAWWRARLFRPDDALGLELLAGVGYVTADLTISSATQRVSDTRSAVNPNFGVGVLWRLRPTTLLHARAVLGLPLGDFKEFLRVEAFAVQGLGRNVAVRAGYAFWRIRSEPGSESGIKLNLSGPSLGLDLNF